MRLPSSVASQSPAPTSSAAKQTHAGAIMVECPLCNNTLYASRDKAGKEILCETCLESVAVPSIPDAPSKPSQTTTKAKTKPTTKPAKTVNRSSQPETASKELEFSDSELTLRPGQPESPETDPSGKATRSPDQSQSGELTLEPLKDLIPPTPEPAAPKVPTEAPQNSPVGNQPTEESEEEIVELEAIGDAPSIPVQPLTPIQATPVATAAASTAPEFELVIRWDTPCSACQAHVVVYQQDVGQTVQCGKCSQPITVAARQPLPRPERVIKQPHHFAGEQTRIAQLSERQPQPKKEVLYQTVIEWQVLCDVCGTGLTATPEDVGQQKKCPDCFKVHTIKAPAKMPKPVKRVVRDELEQLNQSSATGGSESTNGNSVPPAAAAAGSTRQVLKDIPDMRDRIQRDEHAASRQILERAKQEQAKKEETEPALQFEEGSWLKAVAELVTLPTVLSRVAILGSGYALIAALGHTATHTPSGGSVIGTMGSLGLLVVSAVMFLGVSAFAFSTLLNIVRQTAMGDLKVREWPAFDLWSWLGDAAIIFVVVTYASVPAGICFWITDFFLSGLLGILPVILCTVIMTTLFPFFLLSIMDTGSLWQPFSADLNKRLKHRTDLLVKFVLIGIPAVFVCIVGAVMLLNQSKIAVIFAAIMIWLSLVVLCRIVGLLAISMAETDTEI